MTLLQIYYALVTSDTGSMNKAAEKLFISQPTLTSAIKELEAEIGMTIFNRTSRGVTLTNEGNDFLRNARQLYSQFEILQEKYTTEKNIKRKFRVSSQHYSFAIKAFVETVKQYETSNYELGMYETKTLDVIHDVGNSKSEIGILYLSEYNRKHIMKLLDENDLEVHHLVSCDAFVYVWKGHPLAKEESISFAELQDYPCLAFDQGEDGAFYLAEEILSENEYSQIIKVNDRSTALNLMIGLNGYMLCSGIISEELNGSDYRVIPYAPDQDNPNSEMNIVYIKKRHSILSGIATTYVEELENYFKDEEK